MNNLLLPAMVGATLMFCLMSRGVWAGLCCVDYKYNQLKDKAPGNLSMFLFWLLGSIVVAIMFFFLGFVGIMLYHGWHLVL
jgi:hypothetical protein